MTSAIQSWVGLALFAAALAALIAPNSAADPVPLAVPVIKLEYPGNPPNVRMLYLRLLGLGDQQLNQPLLLDTGSSGMTVACEVVLPPELCSTDGIALREDTEFNGILVTTQQVIAYYGTYDEYGNVARAKVSFGSADQPVETAEPIAFLIRYKKVRRSTGEIVGGRLWPKGIFGISPLGGIGPDQAIVSPLAAVQVADGLNRGYSIGAIGRSWQTCTIEDNDCPEVDALALGIGPDDRRAFTYTATTRADTYFNFPTVSACIAFETASACQPTLFDTGNSTISVGGPVRGDSYEPLPKGSAVSLDANALGTWSFTTTYNGEVEFAPDIPHHIAGIRFFEDNILAIDLDTQEIGILLGTE